MSFVAYHAVRATEHQSRFDDLSKKGYRIISLSVYGDPADARYAAVWVERAGPAWRAFHGRTASEYQAIFDDWHKSGYHPVLISATGDGTQAIFAGVFENSSVGPWKARHGIDEATFQSECESAATANQILASASVYGNGAKRLYAAVWHTNDDLARWTYHSSDTGQTYQTWFDEATQLPARPGYVALSAAQQYLSVFRDDRIGEWHARHGMTSDEYQAEFDQRTKAGLFPICVQGGGAGSQARYAAIFAKRDTPLARVWTVTGTPVPALANFDDAMKKVMQAKGVRAASLALGKNGAVRFARGYTWAEPGYAITQPNTLFRLASVSKALTSAAIYELLKAKKIDKDAPVFPMLGLTPLAGQTPDPRLNSITVQNLIDHTGGWDATLAGFDPVFASRTIAKAMNVQTPTKRQIAQYMVGQPLQFQPGTKPNLKDASGNPRGPYSNFGYVMLGLVVEHADQPLSFTDHVKQKVLDPLGIQDVFLARTLMSKRRPNEVLSEDPGLNLTALDAGSNVLLPEAYGGFVLETMDAGGGLLATPSALVQFLHTYAAWGAAPRSPKSARTGSEPGTRTRIGSRPNGIDYAFAFNTRVNIEQTVDAKGTEYIDKFGSDLEATLDATTLI
jgi:CubicO group peptidase (beta-lactamase class C family)